MLKKLRETKQANLLSDSAKFLKLVSIGVVWL